MPATKNDIIYLNRFCLKLHAKSAAAYKSVQEILVLPSERTLRQARNNNEGDKIGIQTEVVQRIKNAIHHCTLESDRLAVLAFDEMAIKGNRCILCLFSTIFSFT